MKLGLSFTKRVRIENKNSNSVLELLIYDFSQLFLILAGVLREGVGDFLGVLFLALLLCLLLIEQALPIKYIGAFCCCACIVDICAISKKLPCLAMVIYIVVGYIILMFLWTLQDVFGRSFYSFYAISGYYCYISTM